MKLGMVGTAGVDRAEAVAQHYEFTFRLIGGGFDAVTALQYSSPNSNASSTERPGSLMKTESVSPYRTFAPAHLPPRT